MQVIRTIAWVIITAVLVAFIAMNWDPVPVRFWPLSQGDHLGFRWPVGIVAFVFFLLGFLPMWLLHRANQWRMHRRINALETSLRTTAPSVPVTPAPQSDTVAEPLPPIG